jgi:putative phage-type endonuclease
MKLLDVQQGTPEWHALRAKHCRTASRAASMMGKGKYQSRNELLAEIHSGITPDNSDKAHIFAKGHEAEALARPIAEGIVGDELYPATGLSDDGYLLASLDGVTMMEDVIFEHKLINNSQRNATAETLEEHYKIQMDQGMAVTGATKCLFMASDGTKADCNWFWYERDESRIQALIAGWQQFDADLADFEPTAKKVEAVGAAVDRLPALFIDLEGDVKGSNLATYQQAVLARIEDINTDLKTDQDFADADKMVKFLGDAEKEVENVKAQALAKTASIDELFRTVDSLKEAMRAKRLDLNKRVTDRKKEVKVEIAQAARKSVDDHIAKLNEGLGGNHMPAIATDFNTAMKGKKTVTSLQSAADDEVARAKIQANETAELIRANLKQLDAVTHPFLFNDRSQLLLKASDDLAALIIARESEHEKAEAKRVEDEREKIRAEEAAKLAAEQVKEAAPVQTVAQETATQEAPKAAPVSINTQSKRPTDAQIIGVLALHYRVHESKVIQWLIEMDIEQASEQLAANF